MLIHNCYQHKFLFFKNFRLYFVHKTDTTGQWRGRHHKAVGFPLFFIPSNSLIFPWFPKIFPWFFLSFHQDILVKKTCLFFLNVALVTLVYANIPISKQLLQFTSLKKHFPQIYRSKRFENGLKTKVPWFEIFFPDFGWKTPVFPWFPWLEKVFKNFPEFPDFPDRWESWADIAEVNPLHPLDAVVGI